MTSTEADRVLSFDSNVKVVIEEGEKLQQEIRNNNITLADFLVKNKEILELQIKRLDGLNTSITWLLEDKKKELNVISKVLNYYDKI